MYCTEIVLLMTVWIGIFVPCFTIAFSLFWVITFGFESSLPTPLDSAAVMNRVHRKVRRAVSEEEEAAGWNAGTQVYVEGQARSAAAARAGGGCAHQGRLRNTGARLYRAHPTLAGPPKTERPPVVVPAKPH